MASRASTITLLRGRRSALTMLALVCAASLIARAAWLGQPCHSPCRSARDRVLVFDETYYVNAARVIAGIRPPAGAPYANAPLGDDPNAEHPQLAKLAMAGLIKLLGDGPLAWRLPSLVMGTLCLLGMFALVRVAGGSPWLAVGAAALMAADNLLLVHGRIATLDVFALAGMLWGAVAYLRDRPLVAGAVIGLAACTKMVAPYVLLVLALFELFAWLRTRTDLWRRVRRLTGCVVVSAGVLIGLLAVLGEVAPPYDNSAGKLVGGGPFGHLAHMFSYAAHETSPHGATGIASWPWQWLIDLKPITYLNVNPAQPIRGLYHVHPSVHFVGAINPLILLAGLIGLVVAGAAVRRSHRTVTTDGGRSGEDRLSALALAWFLGSWLPFVALSVLDSRTSYLYYMVIVMPGFYIAGAQVLARLRRHPRLYVTWLGAAAIAAILLYPFTPLPA
jgi:dolichyl-phosphate-mannose--protein O-mannosyl transferase